MMQVAMALRFGFWNIGKRPIGELVAGLARERRLDLLLLAECPLPIGIRDMLNAGVPEFELIDSNDPMAAKVYLFAKRTAGSIRPVATLESGEVWEIIPPGLKPLLVAGVHLPAQVNSKPGDHLLWAANLAGDLERSGVGGSARRCC